MAAPDLQLGSIWPLRAGVIRGRDRVGIVQRSVHIHARLTTTASAAIATMQDQAMA